ncbi:uncharacterized protein EI97DRAFT_103679 [Westerdykella ornata]|uniref:Uncharacterized protein n=1 Tax=Westerdykella ornata TaxID=318751 RepID=A0A6A6JDW0_WESOR|nr:uncharacterized protein EI97DRAFT_103679 [Westerdykella ornata]KAF2274602.1 hypothetical protein EI97DRAFT_103679 [Westerdykella ornata]
MEGVEGDFRVYDTRAKDYIVKVTFLYSPALPLATVFAFPPPRFKSELHNLPPRLLVAAAGGSTNILYGSPSEQGGHQHASQPSQKGRTTNLPLEREGSKDVQHKTYEKRQFEGKQRVKHSASLPRPGTPALPLRLHVTPKRPILGFLLINP